MSAGVAVLNSLVSSVAARSRLEQSLVVPTTCGKSYTAIAVYVLVFLWRAAVQARWSTVATVDCGQSSHMQSIPVFLGLECVLLAKAAASSTAVRAVAGLLT